MRVTLIHPGERSNLMPPLGILYVAAVLREHGHNVQVLDPPSNENSFIRKIVDFKPDLVGLSVGTTNLGRASEVINILKSRLDKKTLYCAGGVYTTACPHDTLEILKLDLVIIGEGEYTMLDVCNAVEKKQSFSGIKGIMYREGDKVSENERRDLIDNLDSIPFPARDLLDFDWYLLPPGLIRGVFLERTTTILTSRGCPGQCTFCSSHLIFGKKVRRRSVGNVIKEIEHLKNAYGIRGIWFLDDTFTVNKKWVIEFCHEIRDKKINITWGCQARIDTVSEELLKEMKASGCVQVDFGIESGSDKVLSALKKNITADKIIEVMDMTRKVGLRRMVTIMIGNPEETREDIEKTYELLKITSPDFLGVGFVTPYPGTELYDTAVKNKWVDPKIFYSEKWLANQALNPAMCINFSREELIKIRARLQNEVSGFRIYFGVLTNVRFFIDICSLFLIHPLRIAKRLKIVLKSRNIDDFAQIIVVEYRQNKAIEMSKKIK